MTATQMLYKKVARELFLLLAALLLYRFSGGLAAYAIAAWGCVSALRRQTGRAFACLIILYLLTLANPFLLPARSTLVKYALRGGNFFILLSLFLVGGMGRTKYRLPLGCLFAYLGVCAISSATGWMPIVSYMKLFLFSVFLLAVMVGAGNLQTSVDNLHVLRYFLLAVSVYVIMGSFALWPFPQWSSLGAIVTMKASSGDYGAVEDMVASGMYLNQKLLCGVFSHSQALGSICASVFAFVVADMLFVEKRVVSLHAALAGFAVFVIYLTRSRTALLALAAAVFFVMLHASRKIRMSAALRNRVRSMVLQGILLALSVGVAAEARNGTMSKWLRKKSSVAGDERTMVEAVTQSRQGLIAKSMRDFHLNPVFGMGFQVEERHRTRIKGYSGRGLIISASIEKGLLPVMVLGESGIVGSIVFILFLASFYGGCVRQNLAVTAALFTVLMATNMGEATFFSTGGPGGAQWLFTVVGGFLIDMCVLNGSPIPMVPYRRQLPSR